MLKVQTLKVSTPTSLQVSYMGHLCEYWLSKGPVPTVLPLKGAVKDAVVHRFSLVCAQDQIVTQ
jgi:hypothetical protein